MVATRHGAGLLVREFVLMLDFGIVVAHLRFAFPWLRHAWRLHAVSGFRCPLITEQRNLSPRRRKSIGQATREGVPSLTRHRPVGSKKNYRNRTPPEILSASASLSSPSALLSGSFLTTQFIKSFILISLCGLKLTCNPSRALQPEAGASAAPPSSRIRFNGGQGRIIKLDPLTEIQEEPAVATLVCKRYANRPSTSPRPLCARRGSSQCKAVKGVTAFKPVSSAGASHLPVP